MKSRRKIAAKWIPRVSQSVNKPFERETAPSERVDPVETDHLPRYRALEGVRTRTHGEEVVARGLLFGIQQRAEFVDSGSEVGRVSAESDLERLSSRRAGSEAEEVCQHETTARDQSAGGGSRTLRNLFIPVNRDSGLSRA